MPTYDYICDACEHGFELFQQISESPKRKCPKCGKSKLRRLFGTGAALMFKGSGFYQTDYRSDSYKKAAAAESKGSSEGGKSGSTEAKSGDSKPAASETKSESKPPASSKNKKTGGA